MNPANDALTADLPLIDEVKRLYQQLSESKAEVRNEQELDMKFMVGDQWNSTVRRQRETDGRPTFTVNRLPQFVLNITNEMRQSRPSIEVAPIGDGADVDTAEVISGLIRHIEQASSAYSAYDNAALYQVAMGEGYLRVSSRYIDEASFEQELRVRPIANPFTVLFDENSVEPDGSDADVCLIARDMSPSEYRNKYGSTNLAQAMASADWARDLAGSSDWITTNTVRVVEYWKRTYEKATIYQVETVDALTGAVLHVEVTEVKPDEAAEARARKLYADQAYVEKKNELEQLARQYLAPVGAAPTPNPTYRRVAAQRQTFKVRVKQFLVNGVEVIDETDWPGRFIPIVPMRGHEIYRAGKRYRYGVLRAAREPQQIYNIMASAQAETIAMSTKAPWLVAAGQVKNFEAEWEQANVKNLAYLTYNPIDINGHPVAPPARQNFEPAIQAIAATRALAAEDLKAVTGIYDAALGNRLGEESGKAILARMEQSATTNFHYLDNQRRAIKHVGRILVDVIPHFYSAARMVRIVKPTGEAQVVAINGYAGAEPLGDLGGQRVHDLTTGKYDVLVTTGKSYATKRQEGVESMLELSRIVPQASSLFSDLMVKDMDWPGAQLIAKRLKADLAMARPELLKATGEDQADDGVDAEVRAAFLERQIKDLERGLTQAIEVGEQLRARNQQLELRSEVDVRKLELEREIKAMELQLKAVELQLKEQEAIEKSLEAGLSYKLEREKLRVAADRAATQAVAVAADLNEKVLDRASDAQPPAQPV